MSRKIRSDYSTITEWLYNLISLFFLFFKLQLQISLPDFQKENLLHLIEDKSYEILDLKILLSEYDEECGYNCDFDFEILHPFATILMVDKKIRNITVTGESQFTTCCLLIWSNGMHHRLGAIDAQPPRMSRIPLFTTLIEQWFMMPFRDSHFLFDHSEYGSWPFFYLFFLFLLYVISISILILFLFFV